MKSGVTKAPPKSFEFRSYKSYNKDAFVNDLKQVPWSIVDSVSEIDDCVFLWERLFSRIADLHAPIMFKRVKGFKNPWINQDLIDLRKDRYYHHKKAINGNNKYHWSMYRKLRNKANSEERKLKSDYYCQLISEAKMTVQKCSVPLSLFFLETKPQTSMLYLIMVNCVKTTKQLPKFSMTFSRP